MAKGIIPDTMKTFKAPKPHEGWMKFLLILVYLILIIFGVSFAVLNSADVAVNFYVITQTMPIALLIVLSIGLGVLIGFMLGLGKLLRLKLAYKKAMHQLEVLEKEVQNLRVMPIRDER